MVCVVGRSGAGALTAGAGAGVTLSAAAAPFAGGAGATATAGGSDAEVGALASGAAAGAVDDDATDVAVDGREGAAGAAAVDVEAAAVAGAGASVADASDPAFRPLLSFLDDDENLYHDGMLVSAASTGALAQAGAPMRALDAIRDEDARQHRRLSAESRARC